jgi:hypothetical protein
VEIFIATRDNMANILITEEQLKKLKQKLVESKGKKNLTKQQLFTIATLAQKMWETMEDDADVEDWMERKITQAEIMMVDVVKAYMYEDTEDNMSTTSGIDFSDIVIGT